jgi:hypothetical protein
MMPPVASDDRFGPATPTDARSVVLQLREWGTERFKLLPHSPVGKWLIGTSAECVFRVTDQSSAFKHAEVTCEGGRWWIRDLGTHQGLRRDGIPCREFVLTPGVEIGIGATVLVAESFHCAALRRFVQRLLGWGADRMREVDHALRAVRQLTANRSPLLLCGEGDLVPIAQTLQRLALREEAPFVVCDPRRENTLASVRSPANHTRGVEAFASAMGGSLCVRRRRLPADFDKVMQLVSAPESEVRLFICGSGGARGAALGNPMMISLPPLPLREMELPRIIEEYALDAIT